MRMIVIGAFMSLDGVMQAPRRASGRSDRRLRVGGWLPPFWDDSLGDAMDESFSEPFDLLLRRKTYDIFAAHWPFVERDPKASGFDEGSARISERGDEITKYVATHRPDTLAWKNSQSLGGDVVVTLRDLKRQDGPRLLTQGSTEVPHLLLGRDLVNRMRLLVFPLVLSRAGATSETLPSRRHYV